MGVRISKVGGRNMRLGSALCAGIVVVACFLFPSESRALSYSLPAYDQMTGNLLTQTLTKDKSPYVFPGGCTLNRLPVNQTLTIEAGVVIKFGRREQCGISGSNPGGMIILGTLDVRGTESDPVYFTSWYDDFVGGDTNGDGVASIARVSDWGRIRIGQGAGGVVSMRHAVVRYAEDGGGVSLSGGVGSALFDHVEFALNGSYGLVTRSAATVRNSRFHHNVAGAISSVADIGPTPVVDAVENWWGDDSGPTVASNPNGRGQKINGNVVYDPWVGKPPARVPVILIPGILGTEMKKNNELLWMDLKRMAGDAGDQFMDPLQMNGDGAASDGEVVMGDVLRQPSIFFNYFEGLVDTLQLQGFQENKDLFVFPYDWRLSNKVNSQKLKEKIDYVLAQTGSAKVDLVAHSMGGLVAKQYIVDNGGGTVDKLVFIGTPQLGAPKAFKALLAGDTFGVPLVLSQEEMKKLAQNMPSAYELLPSQEYFRRFGGFFFDLASDPADYAKTRAYLLAHGVNGSLVQQSEEFHGLAMDSFVAPGVSTYNIVGCNTPTVGRIMRRNAYLEGGVMVEDYDLEEVAGDGTVPLTSAGAVAADKRFFVSDADHGKMPSQDSVRRLVADIVTNSVDTSPLPNGVATSVDSCHVKNGKLISVHSPVDLHVYDVEGHHVGVGSDGTIDEDIPGVRYEDVGHNKFIFVPTDNGQEYRVVLDATATGTFSFRVTSLQGGQKIQTALYDKIAITPASAAAMTVSGTSADTQLQFDKSGSGAPVFLSPSAVLDQSQTGDFEKPSTTVQFVGASGLGGWYRSVVTTTLQALDLGAGILKTEYSVDGGNTWSIYVVPVVLNAEGVTTLWYRSVDRAGNVEDVHVVELKIDTVVPEATIVFDPNSRDVLVKSVSSTTDVITDAGDMVTVSDQAGNTLVLRFSQKDRKKTVKAELKSLVYNGQELQRLNRNRFTFHWEFDKKGYLQELKQSISVKDDFRLSSEYNKWRNMTIVKGKDVDRKRIKEKLPGLVLFKIQTNKGDLDYNY